MRYAASPQVTVARAAGRWRSSVDSDTPQSLGDLPNGELIERWSLTSLHERLLETGTRLVHHARYAVFQMAEAVRRDLSSQTYSASSTDCGGRQP